MGSEIENRLKQQLNDNNGKVISKISTTCNQTLNEVKDLNVYTEEGFKSIRLSIEHLKKELEDKIPINQLKEFQHSYSMTREQFYAQFK